jgi:hypothetical protein
MISGGSGASASGAGAPTGPPGGGPPGGGPPAPYKKPEKTKWTTDEDTKLKAAVAQHDGKNWKLIASYLPGKSEVQ